jgi:acid phosphatase (class A)
MRPVLTLSAACVLALACVATAQTPTANAPTPMGAAPLPNGYLAGREPDTVLVVPQSPEPGSPRDEADRAIFKATRTLDGTPRWALAQNDVKLSVADFLRDFSCAVGVSLTEKNAPALVTLVRKTFPDMVVAYSRPKDLYRRPRPYLRDPGAICTPRSDLLDKSFDYPSGHATFAWTTGLILAEAAPDRAGPVLARARAFGESRAVCGVHSASAVTEARTAGAVLFAALEADSAFRNDLAAARSEMTALRASPAAEKPEACEAEAALIAKTPW